MDDTAPSDIDIGHLRGWIGRERIVEDTITPRLAASLAAVLDEPVDFRDGAAAPTAIHWCLCPDIVPMSGLGPDGHPARGDFLPPVPYPRRMWAGGELWFSGDFRVGDRVRRTSRIEDVSVKSGRSGPLCFVEVLHTYETPRGLSLRERHDIVYRPLESAPDAPKAPPEPSPPRRADRQITVAADPVLLLRYSAVTFNGHRIHYDRDYCRNVEGYPGLIVHGPLQATLLLHLARQENGGAYPASFAFRGVAPLFDGQPFTVNAGRGAPLDLWVSNAAGQTTMTAAAVL
ncbi:MaoC family dehydratase N-terminal domain-containing protein [Nitratireductor sp. ZSWI3]|uniref:FAS1-like dehydratase domain-containing protein n=1 Tax=Nitratireductor sp. ZSWI3 TaxID=2966359 RepID=UPI0021504829|nr:MaoC family dehydratase N-terminal domain-containing protein [Nitratireductor sp. ZSWI3]MCR4265293.1 MaoC family dehydratase N-terminal domain-containing protein [Nitratireductor sp. ZSWI3]